MKQLRLILFFFMLLSCKRYIPPSYSEDFIQRFSFPNSYSGYLVISVGNGKYELIENDIVRSMIWHDCYEKEYPAYIDFLFVLMNEPKRLNIPDHFLQLEHFRPDKAIEKEAIANPVVFMEKYLEGDGNHMVVKKQYSSQEKQILKACFDCSFFIFFNCYWGKWVIGDDLEYYP